MPRKRTTRSPNNGTSRRTNGTVPSISRSSRAQTASTAPYVRDPRWAMPAARRRTDVVVVDLARPLSAASRVLDEDRLLLTA
jgi:hypothetical protein